MTVESESNRPNEFGFAGDATAPQPEPTRESAAEIEGENIAVPAGDLTGALTDAIDEMTGQNDDEETSRT
jgi:hypothetical protein